MLRPSDAHISPARLPLLLLFVSAAPLALACCGGETKAHTGQVERLAGQVDCRYYGGLNLAEPSFRICFQHGVVKDTARYGNG